MYRTQQVKYFCLPTPADRFLHIYNIHKTNLHRYKQFTEIFIFIVYIVTNSNGYIIIISIVFSTFKVIFRGFFQQTFTDGHASNTQTSACS